MIDTKSSYEVTVTAVNTATYKFYIQAENETEAKNIYGGLFETDEPEEEHNEEYIDVKKVES